MTAMKKGFIQEVISAYGLDKFATLNTHLMNCAQEYGSNELHLHWKTQYELA
jgi:hypothetical protein